MNEEMKQSETLNVQPGGEVKPQKKMSQKKMLIIGGVVIAVAALIVLNIHNIKFKMVENKALDIAGTLGTGSGYFEIDTYPDHYENMDPSLVALLAGDSQDNALEAIRYCNEELGFNGSVYSKMMETSALMGRQSEETKYYRVSWTYHPDDGLEVTYEVK